MRFTLPAIIVFLFCSCQTSAVHSNRELFAIKVDTNACRLETMPQESAGVVRIVPKLISETVRLRSRCWIEKSLGIGTLRNGVDSLEIRLWGNDSTHALSSKERLVIIKNSSGRFSAELLQFRYIISPTQYGDLDSLVGYRVNLGKPKSGWNSLLKQLELLDLWRLPDCFDVPGYADELATDEGGYAVELAKLNSYKVYGYSRPAERQDRYPEAGKLMKIIGLLKSEFDFNQE